MGEGRTACIAMMQRNVEHSTITFDAAISACGLGNKALQLFSTMGQSRIELDAITFHAAISAFETLQQGLASVLNDMRLYHLRLRLRKPPSNRQTYHITCNERQYAETCNERLTILDTSCIYTCGP